MPMLNFQGSGEQFNKTIEQLISLLMNKNLMRERMSGYKELEGMRGQRGMDLESFRQEGAAGLLGEREAGEGRLQAQKQEGAMTQIMQKFYNSLAQDTEANQLKGLIFTGKREGKDVTPLVGELSNRMKTVSASIADAYKGIASPENIKSMLNNLTDETVRKVFGVIGDERQRREVGVPSMEIQKTVAETSRGNLAQKWEAMNVDNLKDQITRNLDTIHRTQDFLKTEGIKKEGGLSLGSLKALLGGSSGRLPDPLTSENRGAAFEWLAEIELNLNANKLPSEIDKRFMKAVKNTFRIQGAEEKTVERGVATVTGTPGEGLPTRESQGFTPAEYGRQQTAATDQVKVAEIARIKERLIADAIMKGYVTQDQVAGLDSLFQRRAEEVYAEDQR